MKSFELHLNNNKKKKNLTRKPLCSLQYFQVGNQFNCYYAEF